MKTRFAKSSSFPLGGLILLSAVLAVGFVSNSARAASATWNLAPTDGNWQATGAENNWSTGVATYPGGTSTSSTDGATFNNASSITTVNLSGASGWNIKNITFDTANCAAFTLNGNNSGTARITGGGIWQMTSTVTHSQTIQGNQFRLHPGGGVTFSNNASSSSVAMTVSAGIKANNAATASSTDQQVALSGSNTGNNTLSGVVADYGGTAADYATFNKTGAGLWIISGANSYSGGTIISAGTLRLGLNNSIPNGNGGGSNPNDVTVNGTLDMNTYSDAINGLNGSGTIDTVAGGTPLLTVGNNGDGGTFSGAIQNTAGTLALTKSGAGTETLSGANTYNGNTTISTGTLALSGSGSINNSSSISIAAGATFDVSALSGDFTLGGSQGLTASGTASAATIKGGASQNINLGSRPITLNYDGSHPALSISQGTLVLNGNAFTVSGSPLTVGGPYILVQQASGNITAPGSYTATGSAIGVGTTGSITVSGGQVQLTVNTLVVPILTWVGALSDSTVDGNWNTTDQNWLNNSSAYSAYSDPDEVIFNDTATGTTNVTLVGTLSPSGILVTNASNYSFSGGGKISGGAILIKDGTGTLTMTESGGDNFSSGIIVSNGTLNLEATGMAISGGLLVAGGSAVLDEAGTFAGNTTISGGTVQVGNGDANGSLPTGTVTDNGTLNLDRTDSITVANVISGSGALNQNGSGQVALNGANSVYSGTITVNSGTLQANNNNSLGITNAPMTVASGATLDIGGNLVANNANFGAKVINIAGAGVGGNGAIINSAPANPGIAQQNVFENITLTADATFGGTSRWDMRGGNPTLTLNSHTLTKTGVNQDSLVSTVVTDGSIIINQGVLSFESQSAVNGAGTITVNAGAFLGHYRSWGGSITKAITLNGGSLTNLSTSGGASTNDADITLTANSTILHNTGSDLYLNGLISSSGSFGLTKLGTGRTVFTSADTYTGNTVINAGTLALVNSGSISDSANISVGSGATLDASARSDGTLTLTGGQTLKGSGTVSGAAVASVDAVITPGTGGIGTLNFSGALTLNALSTNNFVVTAAGGASNKVAVAGLLTPNSSIITVTSGTALPPGTNTLFTYGSVSGTFSPTVVFDVAPVHPASIVDDGAGHINLVVPNSGPVVANIVTNNVTSGTLWKIAIADLKTAAGWSDPDGDTVTLSTVAATSANGTNITHDTTYIYYQGLVTQEDHFTYTVVDPYGATATGTVYLEAMPATAPSISNPAVDGSGHPTFSGHAIPGFTYGVESETSLSGPWIEAGTVTPAADGSWTFTDSNQTNPGTIFYRLYYPDNPSTPPQ